MSLPQGPVWLLSGAFFRVHMHWGGVFSWVPHPQCCFHRGQNKNGSDRCVCGRKSLWGEGRIICARAIVRLTGNLAGSVAQFLKCSGLLPVHRPQGGDS